MDKLLDVLQDKLVPVAGKLSSNKYLSSLSETFQVLMPVILIGSFACLGAFLNISAWQTFIANTGLNMIFMGLQSITLSILSLYFIIVLPYRLSTKLDVAPMPTAITALIAFLVVTPIELYTSIPLEWLGHSGLFTAMIIGFLVPPIVKFLEKNKIYIKMPDSVPQFVEQSFKSVVPALVVAIIAIIASMLAAATPYGNLHNLIFSLVQAPLKGIGLSLPGYLIAQIFTTLFMFCGIHGNAVISLLSPLQLAASAENLEALSAGLGLPNILVSSFNLYVQPGGIGCALAGCIAILLFAKSSRYKSFGRVAIIPSIFNISEPFLFGVPCLLNPIMFIPWMLCPIVNTLVAYFATYAGIVARLSGISVDWTIPQFFSGLLGGGITAGILQLVLITINVFIYLPFIKVLDRQAVAEEAANSK